MPLVTLTFETPEVGIITLNDESNLNAMSNEMAREFRGVIDLLRTNHALRALVITGAGKAFSAGGHLDMLDEKRSVSGEENRQGMLAFYSSFLSILELNVPLIAAINGVAVGAGLCVACACDIRVSASEAKLGFTFLKLGLHPGMGATFLVSRVLGPSAASELLLTGRMISAEEALRIGLVSRLAPAQEVARTAIAIAQEIASNPPEATRQLLETIRGDLHGLGRALEREALCQSINYSSQEFAAALQRARQRKK